MSNMVGGHLLNTANIDNILARAIGGPARPEAIEEMERELTKVIEDFDRAVNVEALRSAKETGKQALSIWREFILSSSV